MACPTCDHTMHVLNDQSLKICLCPRCGTVTVRHFAAEANASDAVYIPKLVDRCREFGLVCAEHTYQWKRLGIPESINTPENRRKT